MKARHKRAALVVVGMAALGGAAWLVIQALGSNLSYFYSPTEVVQGKAPAGHVFRIGGQVVPGTVQRGQELTVRFVVTDTKERVNIAYTGILPDLFKEGQGVIAQGKLESDGTFVADEVLAKHDENYMPPEVADAMSKAHAEGVANQAAQGQQGMTPAPMPAQTPAPTPAPTQAPAAQVTPQ